MCIDHGLYYQSARIESLRATNIKGGQELIIHEILGCFVGCDSVYLPFYSSGTLRYLLQFYGFYAPCGFVDHDLDPLSKAWVPRGYQGIYFGTPTIVNDKPLFPSQFDWTKEIEMEFVQRICKASEKAGYKRIVSGLGSGDISVEERIKAMGGGEVVCFKKFNEFSDYVIVRNLE